jgi:hypothetical protein
LALKRIYSDVVPEDSTTRVSPDQSLREIGLDRPPQDVSGALPLLIANRGFAPQPGQARTNRSDPPQRRTGHRGLGGFLVHPNEHAVRYCHREQKRRVEVFLLCVFYVASASFLMVWAQISRVKDYRIPAGEGAPGIEWLLIPSRYSSEPLLRPVRRNCRAVSLTYNQPEGAPSIYDSKGAER